MYFEDKNNITPLHIKQGEIPGPKKVLVLQDNVADRDAITKIAAKSDLQLDFHFAETLETMKSKLDRTQFDLAILDFHLPDGNGFDALKYFKRSALNNQCATIMITSEAEITIAVTAMKSGCSDYIMKDDLTPATFRRAIINALQKAVLRAKVNDAGRKLTTLRATLREHTEMSSTTMRPMMKRALAQIAALEFARQQSGHSATDFRLDIIEENCRAVIKMCETIERDGSIATEGLSPLI